MNKLRTIIADDERPSRSFLASVLRDLEEVQLIGEAANGIEAINLIEDLSPDLALLDLQMPEIDGLEVARRIRPRVAPLIAFVTAYDEYAIRAFELNVIDYLLKPVDSGRLRQTIERAYAQIGMTGYQPVSSLPYLQSAAENESAPGTIYRQRRLERIPIRRRDDIILLPVTEIASIVADGELLKLTTIRRQTFTINHRLKDLESRLDPDKFIRLSRGTIANIDLIQRISPMPGGTYIAILETGQELNISRLQGRTLRDSILKL